MFRWLPDLILRFFRNEDKKGGRQAHQLLDITADGRNL